MKDILEQDIKYLTGVGPKRAELLFTELNIQTFRDLLYYFPYKYIDKSRIYKINELNPDLSYVQIRGKIVSFEVVGMKRGKRLVAHFSDGSGRVELVWFRGLKYMQQNLQVGKEYIVFGKPSVFSGKLNIVHPEMERSLKKEGEVQAPFQAHYNTSEKLKKSYINSKTISKLQNNLWVKVKDKLQETLPSWFVKKYKLLPLQAALFNIHFPQSTTALKQAQYRLKLEELFFVQLNILQKRQLRHSFSDGFVFEQVGKLFNQFYAENLPFELTGAQKRVVREIRKDTGSGRQMNRLLQGDVGSGKTLVALMSMLIAMDNGFQTCMMAPTEILANQHFATLKKMLVGLPVKLHLLTGSTKAAARRKIHEDLLKKENVLLVGTHALIEDTVKFRNLGLVIIDEQHRFGVTQRAKLWQKNTLPPHVLVMTATPIPRTLAMTVYGDLDVSVIDELPPGRKSIKTLHFQDNMRLKMFGFLKQLIAKGQQVYVVYPLIKESEKMDYKDLEDGFESISRAFPPPKYLVTAVHGKMKPEEKELSMKLFASGKSHILVATTVIEVGVDVPNATVMVIESAERFGLSQLHQLRGRVGRGADQSYCILMSSHKLSNEARQRLKVMVDTNDGFEIADADMKLRGPGDIEGTQQSGLAIDFKIANLGKDGQILQYARSIAQDILEKDPKLKLDENQLLKSQIVEKYKKDIDYSVIS